MVFRVCSRNNNLRIHEYSTDIAEHTASLLNFYKLEMQTYRMPRFDLVGWLVVLGLTAL